MTERIGICNMFDYHGLLKQLDDYKIGKIADSISMLTRENLTVNLYAELNKKKEFDLILSEDWLHVLEDLKIGFPTKEDEKAVLEMHDFDLFKMNQIFIEASKTIIDEGEGESELAKRIHAYYLLLKPELEARIPEFASLKGQDGFLEYLASREERQRKSKLLDETRVTGSICPHCESTNTRKDGNSFYCKDCHKRWRKAGYV